MLNINPRHYLLLLSTSYLLLCCFFCSSCLEPGKDRFEGQSGLGETSLNNNKIRIVFEPGLVKDPIEHSIVFWSNAPTPTIEIMTEILESGFDYNFTLKNVPNSVQIEQISRTIPSDKAQTQRCKEIAEDAEKNRTPTFTTPVTTEPLSSEEGVSFTISLGQCQKTILTTKLEEEKDYRFAVIGDIDGNFEVLSDHLERLSEDPPSFILLLGDIIDFRNPEQLAVAQDRYLAPARIPYYATIGENETSEDGITAFRNRFGRTYYNFRIGNSIFVVIDSADATLSSGQHTQLDELFTENNKLLEDNKGSTNAFLITHIPPFDPAGARNLSFRNRNEAGRLVSHFTTFPSAGIFAGHIHTYNKVSIGSVSMFVTGGGGAQLESFSSIGYHYLDVHVTETNSEIPEYTVTVHE